VEAEPLIKEVSLNAPAPKVWKAITEKEEMKQWYFDIEEFRPEVGFEFQFTGGDEEKQWLHLCRITEAVTEKKLTYSWKYEGYTGISYVTFELFPQGNTTRLRLTHKGLETFPVDNVPQLRKENFVKGWDYIIGTSLKEFLEKSE
jgi:uncharacterized protein YndB with AHSA1/START domain